MFKSVVLDASVSEEKILGILGLFGAAFLFSTVEVASKIIGSRVDPVVIAFIRFFITGLVLMGISIPIIRLRTVPLGWKDFWIFSLNGVIGVALTTTLFHIAIIVLAKAASAAVVISANPVFVLVLARFINDESLSMKKWVSVILGITGVCCFAYESGAFSIGSLKGIGLMLTASFFFALSICISRRVVSRYGGIVLMAYSSMIGSLLIFPFALLRLPNDGFAALCSAWLPITYITLIGTALAYAFYYYGILKTSAQAASIALLLKPVPACLLAAWLLQETINLYMIIGIVFIFSGLFLTIKIEGQKKGKFNI